MPLNPSGQISLAGPVAGQSIAVELGQSATATISLNDTNVRTLAQKPSGVIVMPTDFYGKSNFTPTQKGIFGFGQAAPSNVISSTNIVTSAGVIGSDTPNAGVTGRFGLAAATYGGDKAIFGFGFQSPTFTNNTNLVSNTGVLSSTVSGVGTARWYLSAVGYGFDKAIFGFGATSTRVSTTNLVSNTGVVASDTPGVGQAREGVAAVTYGSAGQSIFGFGEAEAPVGRVSTTNLVSNTGVVASDTPGIGTAREELAATSYGGDKGMFGYGTFPVSPFSTSITNLVSNTGVVASDTPGVGQARGQLAATSYGGDKGIFAFGRVPGPITRLRMSNLVSNTGVVASDTANPSILVRQYTAGAGFSLTA